MYSYCVIIIVYIPYGPLRQTTLYRDKNYLHIIHTFIIIIVPLAVQSLSSYNTLRTCAVNAFAWTTTYSQSSTQKFSQFSTLQIHKRTTDNIVRQAKTLRGRPPINEKYHHWTTPLAPGSSPTATNNKHNMPCLNWPLTTSILCTESTLPGPSASILSNIHSC